MDWQYIDSDNALQAQCEQWRNAPVLAVDTEFIRTDTFYPILALIQVSDGEAVSLVDPLTVTDWEPLERLFRDPSIPKVLHACSEDLEVFRRLGFLPEPLLDTQVGAALAGYDFGLSYQRLVEQCLGKHVPKGETRSDWLQRPLSEAQCRYAALDVEYLPAVFLKLKRRLDEQRRSDWWLEEGRRSILRAETPIEPNAYYAKLKSAWRLDRRQQATLQRVCAWREGEARRRDRPRGRIVKDHVCVEIARAAPRNPAELAGVSDISPSAVRRYGDTLLALVNEGASVADSELPPPLPAPLPRELGDKMKSLRRVVQREAQRRDIPPELLATKRELEALLRSHERSPGAAELPQALHGWREPLIAAALMVALDER